MHKTVFKNEFGQMISPGDAVIFIAQGYQHSISIRKGTYIGLSPSGSPQVSNSIDTFGYWSKSTGKKLSYTDYKRMPNDLVAGSRPVTIISTLRSARVYKFAPAG